MKRMIKMELIVDKDELLESLTGEILVLDLLGKIWITYPNQKNQEWFFSLLDNELFSEVPFAEEQPAIQFGSRLICDWVDEVRSLPEEEILLDLRTDYSGLFNCANDIIAPPWESVYRNKYRLVNEDNTLNVRKFYKRLNMVLADQHTEPDDHIGYELIFTAFLTQKMLAALGAGNSEMYRKMRIVKGEFLSEHLLLWSPLFCAQVEKYAKTNFYKGLSYILNGISSELAELYNISLPKPETWVS